ncbi:GntR family transcriptional regulator [Halanaerobium hydrogeniformans]|uniref:Transcriptional regulator, GntR family n=1 Tax=Halanaerobium hydrogeniformans TaxID=656519 RepID=E4RNV8_HALHG|nr:GntR family transcriptional regulator [Halanaerobium hydrogeniformans]ADQ13648.1 transcriptional regulator, GntR family [Halanaerobium hydrogeniformans]
MDKIKRNISRYVNNEYKFSEKLGQKYKNLGDEVYETVKNKIINHEIKPGERIIDKNLAEQLGVSRSLVRQALTILEKEDLVTSVPRSGFYVKEIKERDVVEIYEIRKILEKAATEKAVPNIPEKDIAKLNTIFENAKKDLDKDKVVEFIKADSELHKVIINNCGNQRLIKLINSYNTYIAFYRVVDLSRVERAKEAYFEHLEIFNAVKERDVELTVELMAKHIDNAKNIIIDNFYEYTYK